jgi:hypothetical protein
MLEDRFGYDEKLPENIRTTFMWLCQDVADLQSKWDFYTELFGKEENTELVSELASWSFNIIEDSLRNDMTMAICRLSDPVEYLGGKVENLSLAYLVKNCPQVAGLDKLLVEFQSACAPIRAYRNKRVGHRDFNTVIKPLEHPLPGISRKDIDLILKLASQFLATALRHLTNGDLNFHTVTSSGAKTLIFWLKAGKELHSRV